MSAPTKRLTGLACALLIGTALFAGIDSAAAQNPTSVDIIKALKPPVRATRSLTKSPAETAKSAEEKQFVDTLKNRQTRSLTTDERDKIVTISKAKPSIDLEINFEYNSATIAKTASGQVTALGEALSSADLKGSTFVLAGHTDGKGNDTYNQSLSERRADAVKKYLMEKYRLDEGSLVTVGYGKSQLKDNDNPLSGSNRRVQIINMAN